MRTIVKTALQRIMETYRENREKKLKSAGDASCFFALIKRFSERRPVSMPIRNWGQVYGELAIMYEDRLPE